MDLRWLSAPEDEVVAAARRGARGTTWSRSPRRFAIANLAGGAMAWTAAFLFVRIVGAFAHGRTGSPADVAAAVSLGVVLVGAFMAYIRAIVWAESPLSRDLQEARATLTARANGYEPLPYRPRIPATLVTPASSGIRADPRYGRDGVEFGNVVKEWPVSPGWTYVIVRLPAPLPHLVLDATENDGRRSDLPIDVEKHQRMSLEGDFDRWFTVWAPDDYGPDALYVLTPDVMAALIDHASGFNVEMVDDLLAFSSPERSDWSTPEPWLALEGILEQIVPKVLRSSGRYRDDRAVDAGVREVAAGGRRLVLRDPRRSKHRNTRLGLVVSTVVMLLYGIPGVIAIVALLSATSEY